MSKWTVADVMTTEAVSVPLDAGYRTVVDTLMEHRISAVPVVDSLRRVVGVVSEADLLRKIEYAGDEDPRIFDSRRRRSDRAKSKPDVVRALMSSPAVTIAADATIVLAARMMDDEKVKRLPVVDSLGRLIGIVTRGDLLKVHLRPDQDVRAEVRDSVDRDLLPGDAQTVQVSVEDGVVTLTGSVERWSTSDFAERLARQTPGTVSVHNRLTYGFDDRALTGPGMTFGVA